MHDTLQKGKIPPQAIDLEKAVIGACLIDSTALDDVFGVITNPEVFYQTKHDLIFKAIKALYEASEPVDLLTVVDKLKALKHLEKVGGITYLVELTNNISSGANAEYHSRILLQKYIGRSIIQICNSGIERAYNEELDVFDILDFIGAQMDGISDKNTKGHSSLSFHDAMVQIPARVEFLTNNDGKITGVPTGLKRTDKHFSGWQDTDLIVIGGDSGMGKTAFVMNTMLAAARTGVPCGMFSMEMSVIQLAIRAVANESNYHMNQLMRNGFEKQEYFDGLIRVVNEMKNLPIYIDDQPALTVMEMKRKARMLKRKYDIKFLVVDFIQMFSGDKDIRINIAEAARELKNIAKELKIPVMALSQLSREVKRDHYKIPSKHHLRESAAIEDAADIIGLIYRPAYYGFEQNEHDGLYENLGIGSYGDGANACLIVAKNRNGSLGSVPMFYVENKTKYIDPEDQYNNDHFLDEPDNALPKIDPNNDNPF